MLLTPKEAAEKWCPQSMGEDVRWPKCQGSDCMVWRWYPGRFVPSYKAPSIPGETPRDPPTVGYCGLAGKPEGV